MRLLNSDQQPFENQCQTVLKLHTHTHCVQSEGAHVGPSALVVKSMNNIKIAKQSSKPTSPLMTMKHPGLDKRTPSYPLYSFVLCKSVRSEQIYYFNVVTLGSSEAHHIILR